MASDEGFATPQESDRSALREKWEAEFSRFFIFPIQCFSNATALRPRRSKSNVRNGSGAWLTARSPATILILRADPAAMAVLSICVSGYIHEEHLVATLNFSWPQVACVPQCPIRGSKVVLASYMDCSHQDCSRNVMDIVPAASDFLYDNSSPSEMIASNALELKLDEGQSHEEITQREMMSPPLGGDQSSSDRPLSALLTRNINTITGLPCSFTELLTNCTKIPNKGILAGISKILPFGSYTTAHIAWFVNVPQSLAFIWRKLIMHM
ncbi:hypothetical protein AXF42_Ash004413 [Apostasia shenzhenica]|uniref:Poor homologous synapsis 1 PH domain-containing protein n=1 Tax=Apostasia shenzhenica TaxID=1088818 RepID=A0A2I0A2U3_9ASPA|nr:hypothetical protein AXF42_Ash004413 [Apostasia shenzhenica]